MSDTKNYEKYLLSAIQEVKEYYGILDLTEFMYLRYEKIVDRAFPSLDDQKKYFGGWVGVDLQSKVANHIRRREYMTSEKRLKFLVMLRDTRHRMNGVFTEEAYIQFQEKNLFYPSMYQLMILFDDWDQICSILDNRISKK